MLGMGSSSSSSSSSSSPSLLLLLLSLLLHLTLSLLVLPWPSQTNAFHTLRLAWPSGRSGRSLSSPPQRQPSHSLRPWPTSSSLASSPTSEPDLSTTAPSTAASTAASSNKKDAVELVPKLDEFLELFEDAQRDRSLIRISLINRKGTSPAEAATSAATSAAKAPVSVDPTKPNELPDSIIGRLVSNKRTKLKLQLQYHFPTHDKFTNVDPDSSRNTILWNLKHFKFRKAVLVTRRFVYEYHAFKDKIIVNKLKQSASSAVDATSATAATTKVAKVAKAAKAVPASGEEGKAKQIGADDWAAHRADTEAQVEAQEEEDGDGDFDDSLTHDRTKRRLFDAAAASQPEVLRFMDHAAALNLSAVRVEPRRAAMLSTVKALGPIWTASAASATSAAAMAARTNFVLANQGGGNSGLSSSSSAASKSKQVQHFLHYLSTAATRAGLLVPVNGAKAGPASQLHLAHPLTVLDLGCGAAQLTAAVHAYLHGLGLSPSVSESDVPPVVTVGVELRPHLVNKLAQVKALSLQETASGPSALRDLHFVQGRLIDPLQVVPFSSSTSSDANPEVEAEYRLFSGASAGSDAPCISSASAKRLGSGLADVVIALHACNTATDEALFRGVQSEAAVILATPCCYKELRPSLDAFKSKRPSQPQQAQQAQQAPAMNPFELIFEEGLRHGTLRTMQAAWLTDLLRCLALEASGYDVQVVELVAPQFTPMNTLLLATRASSSEKKRTRSVAKIQAIMTALDLKSQRLVELLGLLQSTSHEDQ